MKQRGFAVTIILAIICVAGLTATGSYLWWRHQKYSSRPKIVKPQAGTNVTPSPSIPSASYDITTSPDHKNKLEIQRQPNVGADRLYIITGKGQRKLVLELSTRAASLDKPAANAWSPDSQFAYITGHDSNRILLYVVRADGKLFTNNMV